MTLGPSPGPVSPARTVHHPTPVPTGVGWLSALASTGSATRQRDRLQPGVGPRDQASPQSGRAPTRPISPDKVLAGRLRG